VRRVDRETAGSLCWDRRQTHAQEGESRQA
jgi:hypothetical protein